MRAIALTLGLGLVVSCSAGAERPTDIPFDAPREIAWDGTVWTSDYFDADDYLAWSNVEAVYRVGRMVKEPSDRTEQYATFKAVGRGEPLIARDFHSTRPASPADLARHRKVFVPQSVDDSPNQALRSGGPREFSAHARRETWREFEILNTSELDQGQINVRWGERAIDVPTWCLRVSASQ